MTSEYRVTQLDDNQWQAETPPDDDGHRQLVGIYRSALEADEAMARHASTERDQ